MTFWIRSSYFHGHWPKHTISIQHVHALALTASPPHTTATWLQKMNTNFLYRHKSEWLWFPSNLSLHCTVYVAMQIVSCSADLLTICFKSGHMEWMTLAYVSWFHSENHPAVWSARSGYATLVYPLEEIINLQLLIQERTFGKYNELS